MDQRRMITRIFKGIAEIKVNQEKILDRLFWVDQMRQEYEAEKAEMLALDKAEAKAVKAADAKAKAEKAAEFPGKAEKPKTKAAAK